MTASTTFPLTLKRRLSVWARRNGPRTKTMMIINNIRVLMTVRKIIHFIFSCNTLLSFRLFEQEHRTVVAERHVIGIAEVSYVVEYGQISFIAVYQDVLCGRER